MQQRYRLKSSTDFKRVRRNGDSYAHPLVVLVACSNQLDITRFGVTTSHAFRQATDRNRAKRRLRHAILPFLDGVKPGWDIVLIARKPILSAPWPDLQSAVNQLLNKAGVSAG